MAKIFQQQEQIKNQAVIIDQMVACIIDLLNIAEHYLEDVGGCDHSVGVCCCGEIDRMASASRLLQKVGLNRELQTPWQTGQRWTEQQIRRAWLSVYEREPRTNHMLALATLISDSDDEQFAIIKPVVIYYTWKYKIEIPKE